MFNEDAIASSGMGSLKASLVATTPNTTIISFTTEAIEKVAVSA